MKKRGTTMKLGDLIDASLTVREQAKVLARLRRRLEDEAASAQLRRRDAQPRRPTTPRAARLRRARQIEDLPSIPEVAAPPPSAPPLLPAPTPRREAGYAHVPGRAPYWAVTGPAPDCTAGDMERAMYFYRRVLAAIDRGGWSNSERAALYDLEKKWGPRARGEDARFLVAGTAPGRLPRSLEAKIKALRLATKGGSA